MSCYPAYMAPCTNSRQQTITAYKFLSLEVTTPAMTTVPYFLEMSLRKNMCKQATGRNTSLTKLFVSKNISCFLFLSISVNNEKFLKVNYSRTTVVTMCAVSVNNTATIASFIRDFRRHKDTLFPDVLFCPTYQKGALLPLKETKA